MSSVSQAEFPEKLECLFTPSRYKILYGGRGGAKSWGKARALLILAIKKPLRILCAREFQLSLKDSVHKLLSDQISDLGLEAYYDITQAGIKSANGSEFSFIGLKTNVTQVKSYEGVDICWVEEAQSVSKRSWDVLIPTIRKEKSEIWVSFNPELESDETYQRFIAHPPHDSQIVKINWTDNPWFPDTLRLEMESLKARDNQAYLNVWEGLCKTTVDGAIFTNELTAADLTNRITNVPYDPAKPVHRVWDLGWADYTAVWFVQFIGQEIRLIRYVEDNQKTISQYLAEFQAFGYFYDTDWLPHDAENKTLASAGRSIEDIVRAMGAKTRIIPRTPIIDSINAARTMFGSCWFDRTNCADGIQCLRHYKWKVDPDTNMYSKEPMHDWASHGSDAFRMLALAVREPKKVKPKTVHINYGGASAWMS